MCENTQQGNSYRHQTHRRRFQSTFKIFFATIMVMITPEGFVSLIGEVLQYPTNRRWTRETEERRCLAFFGANATVIATIWNKIVDDGNLDRLARPKHLLWALLFLKLYDTEDVHCRIVGWVDPKTFREWSWYFVEKISQMKDQTILLDSRFVGFDGTCNCLITLDCTDCPVMEPYPFDPKWYSQKFNGPAVKYEVAVCIKTGHIVWISGPHPASLNDASIFIQGLSNLLAVDEGAEVDGVYKGHDQLKAPSVAKTRKARKQKSIARGRGEINNSKLKVFGVLCKSFRNTGTRDQGEEMLVKHGLCFDAVAVVTQLKYESGEKIFDVVYDAVDYS